jgi:hypothetical protein
MVEITGEFAPQTVVHLQLSRSSGQTELKLDGLKPSSFVRRRPLFRPVRSPRPPRSRGWLVRLNRASKPCEDVLN